MKKQVESLVNQTPASQCKDCKCTFDSNNQEIQASIITGYKVEMVNTNLCGWCIDLV